MVEALRETRLNSLMTDQMTDPAPASGNQEAQILSPSISPSNSPSTNQQLKAS